MIRFSENIKATFFRFCARFQRWLKDVRVALRRVRYLRSLMVTLVLIALLGAGVAWSEYQTNWFARRLGAFLLSINALRPESGALWKDIQAQVRTQQAIDTADPLPVPRAGLPDAVTRSRFEGSRVPESGVPGYVAIYKIPLPGVDLNTRPLGDVIASLRVYRQGLAIVKALYLPDVHFHAEVRKQIDYLYAQVGDIEAVAPDTLGVTDPDSLKAAVFSEFATAVIPDLRLREKDALITAYQNGQITKILLYRDLGRFRGELFREGSQVPVVFEIEAGAVSEIVE
ncbi:MAG: hypothetical protein F4Y39_00085 [Gemmatimonadetes bacterium]|nr:hypothetical protein [Gemmatimonadota bacterium]MYK50966.1 hypothetical protein [Gemmatimonadota bacterium]